MRPRAPLRVALIALIALAAAPPARADQGPNPGPTPPAATPAPKEEPARAKDGAQKSPGQAAPPDAAPPPTAPSIAPPAPDAPAEKVEKAKETAKAAALHPLEPSPKNPLKPAFQLYLEIDLPVLGLAAVFGSARLVKTQPAFCAPLCDPSGLNPLDKLTAGFWSPAWGTASDFGLYGSIAAAATFLTLDEGVFPAMNDAVVIAESALSATGVASILTLAEGRPRPFLYGTAAPLSERDSADAGNSFLSSHTCVTAAIGMSMFMTMRRLHPEGPIPEITLAVGGAATVFVALARVEAGKHFITDVVGGAAVGVAVGTLLPALHGSPVRVIPVVSEAQKGVGVGGTF